MQPIIKAAGFFALFVFVYIVTTLIAIFLMNFASVAIEPGAFLATGGLTIVLSIIAAVMSYHYWDIDRDVKNKQLEADQEYRMELLSIAEREKDGLEQRELQVPLESQEY